MKPIDYRNETFASLTERLAGDRLAVLEQLRLHGANTTRSLAALMGWDILNVRPRVTELVQLGFVRCIHTSGHEGVYEARPIAEAEQLFDDMKTRVLNPQLSLPL